MHAASTIAAETTNPIGLPWGEVLIAAIAFAVLLYVLGKFAWPMFEKAYAARTAAIEGGIAQAAEAQHEAAAALSEYSDSCPAHARRPRRSARTPGPRRRPSGTTC